MAVVQLDKDLESMNKHRYNSLVKAFGKEAADEIMAEETDADEVELDEDVNELLENADDTLD